MDIQSPVSRWVLGAAVALVCGAVLDVVGLMPGDWGRADTDTYVMSMGLWRVCLARRNGTGQEAGWDVLRCTFPSQTAAEWAPPWIVFEVLAALCSVAVLAALAAFGLTVKHDWLRSRRILTTIIPLSILAALFNLIGSLLIGSNLSSFQMTPRYPLVLDSIAVVCFTVGAVLAVFDIEGVGMRVRPAIGKGLRRHI